MYVILSLHQGQPIAAWQMNVCHSTALHAGWSATGYNETGSCFDVGYVAKRLIGACKGR